MILMIGSVVCFAYEGASAKVASPIATADKQLSLPNLDYSG
jgi:hypothetical protein